MTRAEHGTRQGVYHGASKLRGEGPRQTAQMFEQLGFRPGTPWALATGMAEAFAGIGAILGIATRPAAVAVLVTQAVAIARVHAEKGYSITRGGFEYDLALTAIAAGLLVSGPGRISAHEVVEHAAEGARRALRQIPASIPAWAVLLSLASAPGCGPPSGVYPAPRASRLDSFGAMRTE